jgi:hypothetical protein
LEYDDIIFAIGGNMEQSQIREKVADLKGKIFSVKFIKRSTGELREMVCRTGVKKNLAGGELPFDPIQKNLLMVYDMQKNGYRSIPLENVLEIKIKGELHEFQE